MTAHVESSSELIPPSAGGKSEAGKQIRNPHDIPHQSLSALVEQWSEARGRTVLAKHAHVGELLAEDLFAELAYGARIAQEATAGRWCVVADLLRVGAMESWAQVGTAMDLTETEARDGFHDWIAGQVDLQKTSATLGITEAEAEELYVLADAVAW
ncbi:hypothetical protein [Actinocrispum sp. NPDC049592]|uniref:hypothetical protein n=1 Tax=Actinocrispum sp. NPDC049592 TaxID=3154835 RepID=UPI003411FAA7